MSPAASTKTQPAWLADVRTRAREFTGKQSLPGRDIEAWRKIDLSALASAAGGHPAGPARTEVSGPGAELLNLTQAASENGLAEFVEEALTYYEKADGANYFTALNTAAADEAVLRVSGASTEPIRVVHTAGDGAASDRHLCPRVMIYVEPGAEVTLIEEFQFNPSREGDDSAGSAAGDNDGFRLIAPLTDVYCAANSRLNYVMIGDFAPDDFHFHHFRARLQRDSRLNLFLFPLGGFSGKSFYRAEAREPGAEAHATGCAVGRDREFNDMDITMAHHADHTLSSILYRTVVRDRAHHVFYGHLDIEPGLKGVDSHQTNNNILLNRRARAESMPNLIVRAEDVSAEHGATVGELDKEALYFLMARGIPETEARALLIEGFINSILRNVPDESLREELDRRLKMRLI